VTNICRDVQFYPYYPQNGNKTQPFLKLGYLHDYLLHIGDERDGRQVRCSPRQNYNVALANQFSLLTLTEMQVWVKASNTPMSGAMIAN
jgi:hypothetical protein